MCALLSEYSNEKIDVAHTMLMVLMHDLVEIDAGDTYAYDEEGNKSKEERELKAADPDLQSPSAGSGENGKGTLG